VNSWESKTPQTSFKVLVKNLESPGVSFINILREHFTYKSVKSSFSQITAWLCNFWQKNIGKEALHKMLMKLATVEENETLL